MSFHKQLRQRYSRFNQSQLSLTEKLYQELNNLEQYLRTTLGMDKYYKKAITDTEPTEAYLRVHNPIVIEENADMPSVRFGYINKVGNQPHHCRGEVGEYMVPIDPISPVIIYDPPREFKKAK